MEIINYSYLFIQVEYILVKFDHEKKVARVSLRASEVLNILQEKEVKSPQ